MHSCSSGFSSGHFERQIDSSQNVSDGETETQSDSNNGTTVQDLKEEILEASLPFVNDRGWTLQSIASGAVSAGFCGTTHGLFPRGGVELVDHFTASCNRQLVQDLETNADIKQLKTVPCLQAILELRLKMLVPYINQWPMAMGLLAAPANIVYSSKNLSTLIDNAWYYAGDRTADFDWYTKRMGLAAIYVAAELTMVQDKSEDFKDTFSFLSRRLHQMEKVKNVADGLPGFISGSTVMLQNILGFGYYNR